MTVRLKSTMAGPRGTFQPGTVTDFEVDIERDLVAGGYAEYVGHPPRPAPVREQAIPTLGEQAIGVGQPQRNTLRRGR